MWQAGSGTECIGGADGAGEVGGKDWGVRREVGFQAGQSSGV